MIQHLTISAILFFFVAVRGFRRYVYPITLIHRKHGELLFDNNFQLIDKSFSVKMAISDDEREYEEDPNLINEIEQLVREQQPSDWQVRLDILGFTPLTIAGFVLAGAILSCNSILGNGWASRLLGWEDGWTSTESPPPVTLRGASDVQPTEEQLRILEKIKENYY